MKPSVAIHHKSNSSTPRTPPQQQHHPLFIMDGGTGREIERRGGPFRQPEWSALCLYEQPSLLTEIHESYLEAGATAITTNTYAVVPFHLGEERYQNDGKRLLNLATDLALKAKRSFLERHPTSKQNIQVMGSIPPICGSYKPELFDEAKAKPILQDFLDAFRGGKVDAILLETLGSLREAKFVLECLMMEECDISVPIYLSFCVRSDPNDDDDNRVCLFSGESLTSVISELQKCNLLSPDRVPLVLVNCCGLEEVDAALQELSTIFSQQQKQNTTATTQTTRYGAYPNAFGAPPSKAANKTTRQVREISPSEFAKLALHRWHSELGASVIGGCCGIGPEHIRAVAEEEEQAGAGAGTAVTAVTATTTCSELWKVPYHDDCLLGNKEEEESKALAVRRCTTTTCPCCLGDANLFVVPPANNGVSV